MTIKGKAKDAGVTLRAVLIALVLILVDNYWITVIEVRWYGLDGTCLPLFITPIFILFLLAIPNLAVRNIRPHLALKRGELITIYMMIVMGATLASHDMIQNLFGTIGQPHYMATDINKYADLFFRYLPSNLFISNEVALKGFYRGISEPWVWQIMKYWVGPLSIWGMFVMVLIGMMMCLNIIIRKQWTENEKLVFPLVQLPIEMASEDSGKRLYGNKLMWAGFGIAFLIGLVNGFHTLFPSLPYIEWIKGYNLGGTLTTRPWSAMAVGGNGLKLAAYPFAIGLAYFIPLDLSFSCWFFYLARKMWQVVGAGMGWDSAGNGFPYYEAQSSGAWLALGAIIIIGSIPYLKGVWKQAFSSEGTPEELSEGSLYRKSICGLGIGLLFLMAFSRWLGMSGWVALVFFGIYFLISITLTRVRAELGTPHEIYFVNPQQIMVSILGYNVLGPVNLTIISAMYWFNRGYRSHPMPNMLEAFKMADGTAIKLKPMIFALTLAAFFGLITAYYSNLNVTYLEGAQAKASVGFKGFVGGESFDRLTQWLNDKPIPDVTKMSYMAVGAAIVVGLKTMRMAFISWPFHPAGYALAISYAMDYFWFAFLLSWFIKLMIIRYGGMKLHNTFVPLFLGLILGDFFIGSIWALVGPLLNTATYRVFI